MDKIKKYVERFSRPQSGILDIRYRLESVKKLLLLSRMWMNLMEFLCWQIFFEFGYAKGYRAALAEMKKKGGAV